MNPSVPIKPMLEKEGYPFKSKKHSEYVDIYQRNQRNHQLEDRIGIQHYLNASDDGVNWSPQASCPKALRYQFTSDFKLKVSDKCCKRLKVDPLKRWQKENNRPYGIIGLMRSEGGRRISAKCLAFKGKRLNFQPLVAVTKEWEDWFIDEYQIEISDIYKPPYNFKRTGCKGCPFVVELQRELDVLEEFFPKERKQCEIIWKPVYDEYRRLGYRLRKEEKKT